MNGSGASSTTLLPTDSVVPTAPVFSLDSTCDVSPLLRRITRGEVLILLGIGIFAEMLSVGWIAMVLGVDEGRATWGQAVGMAVVDIISLVWLPVPLFALYDALPLEGRHRSRHLFLRSAGVVALSVTGAFVTRLAAQLGGRMLHIDAAIVAELGIGVPEQLFWASCGVVGTSIAYLVLRRLHRARDVEQRNAELRRLAVEAQLAALSAELRPHFLFNAINNLAELVHQDPARTEAMLLHLSSLLRGTLAAGQHRTVTLADELAHVDDYLALQQMRFGERLTVLRDIAPALARCAVPPMLLQPLLENAIEHGIEGRVGASTVWIHVRSTAGSLEVQVDDDGPGPHRSGRVGTGTGLRNVRARLHALYGDAGSATLEERPGGGGRMTVRLPLVGG